MMLNLAENLKYSRQLSLPEIGEAGQLKLKQSSVLVVGAGGLGCPVLQYLAAAGVGNIHIVDSDRVEASNLQRQVLFTEAEIGLPKSIAAAQRLRAQNTLIEVHSHHMRLSAANVLTLFRFADIVVDCSDDFITRYLICDAAVVLNKPVVYGAVDRFQGQVAVFNLHNMGPTYRCFFPKSTTATNIQNCSETGVLGVLPGIIGSIQAMEVLKIICNFGELLSGRVLLLNALDIQFTTLQLERNPESELPANEVELLQQNYSIECRSEPYSLSCGDLKLALQNKEKIAFVDVREEGELPNIAALAGQRIPFSALESRVAELDHTVKLVLFCKSGARSAKAIALLTEKYGFTNCLQLDGGIDAWLQHENA